jgi:solute carrier family 25 phosphate transporter 23/24/25/41
LSQFVREFPPCLDSELIAVAATYPLDLVRARLAIASANMATNAAKGGIVAFSKEDARLGMIGMTKKVYRTEGGLRGL